MRRWRCMVCGYIHSAAEPPEACPVCKAPRSMFVEIDEQGNKIPTPASQPTTIQAPPEQAQSVGGASSSPFDRVADFIQRHHLHPILVHTPNGLIPPLVLFMISGIMFDAKSLERAAFYNLLVVLLAMPAVLITGYIEWTRRYNQAKTFLFFVKISCSLVVFAAAVLLAGWRFMHPDPLSTASPAQWIYIAGGLVMLTAAGIAGHLGGKLVFGSRAS